ncbi:MAG: alternative ribosome rescue aminoacyl-tRNA hydrolase ArfB [Desulfosalsimonadaceae bacterium]
MEIPDSEIEVSAIGAKGPGGQSVNKSATAVHLRFDIKASSLPEEYKVRLLAIRDQRITKSGVIVIKSMRYRSLEANREEALRRLYLLIQQATARTKQRKPSKPGFQARQRRMDQKTKRSRIKSNRRKVDPAGY